jgi:hypothetical protein
MSDVVLYLLGAGASSETLPMARHFENALREFVEKFKRPHVHAVKGGNNLLNAITWLADETSRHYSVDTFAKKLFLSNDHDNLRKLKAALSAYLVITQSSDNVGKRYDAFFASILKQENNKIALPSNIRILTWNYDTQLEKSFYGFCANDEDVYLQITFNQKQIFRINGHCGTFEYGKMGPPFKATWKNTEAWADGIYLYEKNMELGSVGSEISFAWEGYTKNQLDHRIDELKLPDVKVIVVIGYSFPYFNREVDGRILMQCTHAHTVYLQYPKGEHTSVRKRLENMLISFDKRKILDIESTDLFYIPDEF